MINLYRHGMSWTADGAFVNEGIEGIHIKDICNWGVDSPFIPMFETKDIENVPVRFGILSKNDDVNKHIHIKLVNAPYKIKFEKTDDGYKESKVASSSYNSTKPTYIQLFDDRLASEEQMNNNSIFDVYDIKEDKDRFAIACSKDSVQPLHFRVTPGEVEINYKKYKEARGINKKTEFKNLLTQWSKFSIVNSNKDGGISLWVGNNDISKKRFVLPESSLKSANLSPDKMQEANVAQFQVQDDTVQVGKYWTSTVANMLTEYTAKELANKVAKHTGDKAQVFKLAIDELVNEGKLHKDSKLVYEKNGESLSALDNILSLSPVNGDRKYNLKAKEIHNNVTEGLMSYPFDAIEFSPDVMSVFAYPFIKNMAVSEDTIGLSRFEMFKMGEDYYNQMPSAYRNTYKEMDNLLANDMSQKATEILKSVEKASGKILFDGSELTKEGKEIYTLLAADITKFLIVSSLAPKIKPLSNSAMLEYNLSELSNVDLNSLNLQYEVSPEASAKALISKIKSGLNSIPKDSQDLFVSNLTDRISSINSDAINVAKLIVEKTESGLDWRIDAAKDVGDWENLDAGRIDVDKNKNGILAFWNRFNNAVHKYNPRSYIIGELTDWNEKDMPKSQFLQRAGFTTMSDYEHFFSTLPALYGENDEGKHENNFAETVNKKLDAYFNTGTLEHLNFSHRFVGNQDKPRISHLMATKVSAFNDDKGAAVSNVLKEAIVSTPEYQQMNDSDKSAIINTLEKLQNGEHTVQGYNRKYDAENFGIRPFDFTLDDIVEDAIADYPNFREFAKAHPDKVRYMKANALKNALLPAMKKYRSILFSMVALPGTPTNYAGDELGMTGWETFCKNEKQENRNAIRWDMLANSDYTFVKDYYENDLKPLFNIRNKEAASALVNGTTQPLHNQQIKGGGEAVAFYRYNDKTDAICILHGQGYGNDPKDMGKDAYLSSIKLGGLKSGLPVGTIYKNALNNERYKVVNAFEIKKLADNGKDTVDEIPLGNAGVILLREKDFNNNTVSFKGKVLNPYVKLANLKYNLNSARNK